MSEAVQKNARMLPYVSAITEGVQQVLREQDNAFVAGEDVGQAGSVFGYIKAYWPNLVIAVSSIRRSVRRALLGWESELLQRVADPSLM